MNIKVITRTRHTPNNYGSLLQSIATIKAIESLGHSCEIIDYWKYDEIGLNGILTSLKGKPSWRKNILKRFIYVALRYPGEKIASSHFNKMRKKYLNLTPRCYFHDDLRLLDADIFMTGSDQVWGPLLNGKFDDAYFLSFVSSKKPKVAYASSFGRTDFSESIISEYKKLLSKYDFITVRENNAVSLLQDWNIKCEGQVLDPTLLLDPEQWSKYIEEDIKGEYVLIYEIHNNPLLDHYAKKFANHINLPLIRISPMLHQINRGGKFVLCPEIGLFLSYIKNAKYMVTDSFHGTAFAINFNRQFIEVLPNNKTGARNQSILQLTGLQNRIVSDFNDFSFANKSIDYSEINQILASERKRSFNTLRKIIEQNIVKE